MEQFVEVCVLPFLSNVNKLKRNFVFGSTLDILFPYVARWPSEIAMHHVGNSKLNVHKVSRGSNKF